MPKFEKITRPEKVVYPTQIGIPVEPLTIQALGRKRDLGKEHPHEDRLMRPLYQKLGEALNRRDGKIPGMNPIQVGKRFIQQELSDTSLVTPLTSLTEPVVRGVEPLTLTQLDEPVRRGPYTPKFTPLD